MNMENSINDAQSPALEAFAGWMQNAAAGYPAIASPAFTTPKGTPYLRAPGVALLSRPQPFMANLADFLNGFDPALQFVSYLDDGTELSPGAQICKTAGQLCYASFGPKRTKNENAERYFDNIKESGHGSVLEHANYTFLFYGISRSVTHELVRHRAGFAFSQISQRYVSGSVFTLRREAGVLREYGTSRFLRS